MHPSGNILPPIDCFDEAVLFTYSRVFMASTVTIDLRHVARGLDFPLRQVQAVVELLDEGNTVPFITRYRKDQTGGLDEEQIREIQDRLAKMRLLADRKQTILRSIEAQGKLTEKLAKQILAATTTKRLEDLYLPFKPKKQTLATLARSRGLEELASEILEAAPGGQRSGRPGPRLRQSRSASALAAPTRCWGPATSWPSNSANGPICGSGCGRSCRRRGQDRDDADRAEPVAATGDRFPAATSDPAAARPEKPDCGRRRPRTRSHPAGAVERPRSRCRCSAAPRRAVVAAERSGASRCRKRLAEPASTRATAADLWRAWRTAVAAVR